MSDDRMTDEPTAEPAPRVFTGHLVRRRRGHGYAFSEEPPPPPPAPARRPARVAEMLALAHRLQRAIDAGEYKDRAEIARQLALTRARVTQILDLLLLAPDIQEELIFLERVDGQEPLTERALRPVVSTPSWEEQRRQWSKLIGQGVR